jgi:ribonuclease R
MADHVGEVFTATVTGVANYGLFVQLENTAEGLVHVDSMGGGGFRYDPQRFMLQGEGTGKGSSYRLGQMVRVRLVSVSLVDTRIDFELAT